MMASACSISAALAGIDDDAYDACRPCNGPAQARPRPTGPRLFARGGFPTANGRGRMVALAVRPKEEQGKTFVSRSTPAGCATSGTP